MEKIIWKAFVLSELLERKTPPSTNVSAKELNIFDEPFDGSIALITRAETNNGIRGYIDKSNYETEINAITYNDQFSFFLYHNYEFTTIKDHLSIIKAKNNKFQLKLDEFDFVNGYLVKTLNRIYSKKIFNFNFTGADYRFDREIILLPCLEVKKTDEYIWEEEGKFYTLAVSYIKKLMDKAKELKEQKTIRYYEKEKAKYEKEKAKYEKEYLEEKKKVVWKSFALGDLFGWSSRKDLSLKKYNMIDKYEDGYVEVVTGSMNSDNEFVLKTDLPENYPVYKDCLCLNCNGSIGYCFYYKNDLVSPTSSVHILQHKNVLLEKQFNEIVNKYFAKIFTKIFTTGIYNRTSCLIDNFKFNKEIVSMPCLVGNEKDSFCEENNTFYTLAMNYISYIYLQGRCNYYQKLIDEYTYKY